MPGDYDHHTNALFSKQPRIQSCFLSVANVLLLVIFQSSVIWTIIVTLAISIREKNLTFQKHYQSVLFGLKDLQV